MGWWLNGVAIEFVCFFWRGCDCVEGVGFFIQSYCGMSWESESVFDTMHSPDDEPGGVGLKGVFFFPLFSSNKGNL